VTVTAIEIAAGSVIGDRYVIKKLLGQGGFGRTYLAYDKKDFNHPCVLKEFIPTADSSKTRKLFLGEVEVFRKLQHPQIPQFRGLCEASKRLFIVQGYINGQTYSQILEARLKQGQVFSEAEIILWFKELLPVFDYIHSCKVIHRDVSPDNIMLPVQGGQPMLIDFFLFKEGVRELNPVEKKERESYSAPELEMGKCYPNSDLYSLAITALVLLTGQPPSELFNISLKEWRWRNFVQVSDGLGNILDKMLQEHPKDRYQTAQEVLAQFSPTANQNSTPLSGKYLTTDVLSLKQDPSFSPYLNRNLRKSNKFVKVALTFVLLLGGGIVTINSPQIPYLCKLLDNCAIDKQFQEVYQREVNVGEQALNKAKLATSIVELENSRDRLQNMLHVLGTIPEGVKVYPESQKKIAYYQFKIKQIEINLDKQKQANNKLYQIKKLLEKAKKATEIAQTPSEYEEVKEQWKILKENLENIPKDAYNSKQVKAKLAEVDYQIKQIQNFIPPTP
jgi:serine/threonine-protein kinase